MHYAEYSAHNLVALSKAKPPYDGMDATQGSLYVVAITGAGEWSNGKP